MCQHGKESSRYSHHVIKKQVRRSVSTTELHFQNPGKAKNLGAITFEVHWSTEVHLDYIWSIFGLYLNYIEVHWSTFDSPAKQKIWTELQLLMQNRGKAKNLDGITFAKSKQKIGRNYICKIQAKQKKWTDLHLQNRGEAPTGGVSENWRLADKWLRVETNFAWWSSSFVYSSVNVYAIVFMFVCVFSYVFSACLKLPEKLPDLLESFQTAWNISRPPSKFLDSLESFQTIWMLLEHLAKFSEWAMIIAM